MNLTPQQLATQEAMLLRLYPDNNLEEAREKEVLQDDCLVKEERLSYSIKEEFVELYATKTGTGLVDENHCIVETIETITTVGNSEYLSGSDQELLQKGRLVGFPISIAQQRVGSGRHRLNDSYKYTIIGLPPTLPRVLDALGDGYFYHLGFICHMQDIFTPNVVIVRDAKRKLRNEDGTDAILWDQSQETQDAIGGLMK